MVKTETKETKKEIKLADLAKDRVALPLRAGDTVRVWQKIVEEVAEGKKGEKKQKARLQAFEGLVLARKHSSEAGATFTVRRVASGVGVERIFPLYSPAIDKIEVLKRAKVRRAKLYHIRHKAAKDIKREMRNIRMASETPAEETKIAEATTAEIKAEAATK